MGARSADNSGLVLWGALVVFGWLIWAPIEERLTGKLTAYAIMCSPESPGLSECPEGRWEPYERVVFGVRAAQQTVVIQFDNWHPVRLTDCAVLDRLNWRCAEYVAKDGEIAYPAESESVRFLPRWRWYAFKYLGIRP